VTENDAETPATRPARIVSLALAGAAVLACAAALWAVAAVSRTLWAISAASALTAAAIVATAWYARKIFFWHAAGWAGGYLTRPRVRLRTDRPLDVCFQFIDHFEPDFGGADGEGQLSRVRAWESAYAAAVKGRADSDGRCPQHTWFFPVADNDPEVRQVVATWPARQWGEIEYHIHHHPGMDEDQVRGQIVQDIACLGGLGAAPSGRYGFVHGMFALAGGDPRYCNVPNEIDVLLETGCYADFTFGAIGTPAQPRQVNSIYYARSTGGPKPYDTGDECAVGGRGRGLLIIPGPMCLGLFPRALDDAHVEPNYLPHPRRIGRWLDAHVHVRGRPNWVFISVHSHTARQDAAEALLGGAMQRLWDALEARFRKPGARLHYLTAREAYNVVKAAEAGLEGDPNDYRDFEIHPPPNRNGPVCPESTAP